MTTGKKSPRANEEESMAGNPAMVEDGERSRIAERAYQFYEDRGRLDGAADEDWYRAEEEIRSLRRPPSSERKTENGSDEAFAA